MSDGRRFDTPTGFADRLVREPVLGTPIGFGAAPQKARYIRCLRSSHGASRASVSKAGGVSDD